MNLLRKTGLSDREVKIIKRVTSYSVTCCIALVIGAWSIQQYLAHKEKLRLISDSGTAEDDYKKNEITELDLGAHRFMIERLLDQDQPENAIPHLHRILAFKRDRYLQSRLADAYLEAGYYQKAYETYKEMVETGTEDSLTLIILARSGISLFYIGKKEESKKILESCLTQNPHMSEASCFLGQISATNLIDSSKALAYLQDAVKWDSNYVEGWYQLARFSMSKGRYNDARVELLKALEINPLHVKSHSRLGMVYYYMGNNEQARKSYQTALALNPHDFNTRYNLGELFYSSGSAMTEALSEFKTALQDNPGHVEANFKAGLICTNNGMTKEAIRFFEQALNNDPKNVRIMLQMAVAFEKIGDRQRAMDTYNDVLAVDALNRAALQKIKLLSH